MQIHNRQSIRLKGYDYSQQGLYFITICCQNRACLFGEIIKDKMILNEAGNMISTEWLALKKRFHNIELHEYIVMPKHFHGLLEIVNNTVGTSHAGDQNNKKGKEIIGIGQPQGYAPTSLTVGNIIGAYKSITSVAYIRGIK